MASPKRVTPPQTARPEVDVPWGPVGVSLVTTGQRRLEARTFLTDGYGLRRRIEDGAVQSSPMRAIADVWQPSRLKGYVVPAGNGLPFLSAGQAFEAQPRVRKWIAEPMVRDAESRRVGEDMLLLSCSGEVGKVTAVYPEHLKPIITHDLLRVVPRSRIDYGWIYAYMKTPIFYAMARSAQYGHMIKHLEPSHVRELPVVLPDPQLRASVANKIERALEQRRNGRRIMAQANSALESMLNPTNTRISTSIWQSVPVADVLSGRRRLEAQYQRSDIRDIEHIVRSGASHGVARLEEVTKSVRLENRFKRYFSSAGTPYKSASEIFDVNPPISKRIYAGLVPAPDRYYLTPGEMVMARSGQVYGLLGRVRVIPAEMAGVFGSDDLIRIAFDESSIASGYLQTFLSNEKYGRPLVVRNASGTSIPHLDPVDVREIPVPRFSPDAENAIAELADSANDKLAEADRLESDAIAEATRLVADAAELHGLYKSSHAVAAG